MKVKQEYLSFCGLYVHREDIICITSPMDSRELLAFTLDANHSIVPVMQYHSLMRKCRRHMAKSKTTADCLNPLIAAHSSLSRLLSANSKHDIGVQNETVIDCDKLYSFLTNLRKGDYKRPTYLKGETLQRLFANGGYKLLSTLAVLPGERAHSDYIRPVRDSSTDILMRQYKEWIVKSYAERAIGMPVYIKPKIQAPAITTTNDSVNQRALEPIDADLIDNASVIMSGVSPNDLDLMFMNDLDLALANDQPSDNTNFFDLPPASPKSSTELTFLFNKKRETPSSSQANVNKRARYSYDGKT